MLLLLAIPTLARTITVTNCDITTSEVGSLPWALEEAKAIFLPEISIIEFNIPTTESGYITTEAAGVGFWRIQPTEPLVLGRDSIEIRGSTQAQNQGDKNPYGPEIEIDGSGFTETLPLIKIADNNKCTIEGLVINNSKSHGVSLFAGNINQVRNCYIGTKATGEAVSQNAGDGIWIDRSEDNQFTGNLVSGNAQNGIELINSTYTRISDNIIGPNRTGTAAIGNGGHGLYIYSGAQYQYVAPENTLAFNGGDGIRIDGSTTHYNTLTQNSYFSNTGWGVRLTNSANDAISYPIIETSEVYSASNQLFVQGSGPVSSTIELLKVETPEAEARGEGKKSLGFAESDEAGNWFVYLSTNEAQAGDKITALATDHKGNTSEFAENQTTMAKIFMSRPDGMIGLQSDGSDYAGENIFNLTGNNQEKDKTIYLGQALEYYIKINNAGNVSPESMTLTGTGSSTDWKIYYYDAKSGGNDVTSQIVGSGLASPALTPGASFEVRMVVQSTGTTVSTKEIYITAASVPSPTRKDVVRCITTAEPSTVSDRYSFEISIPSTCEAQREFKITLTAKDPVGQVTTEVSGRTYLSVDAGTISLTSLESTEFSDDGIFNGWLSLSNVGIRTLTVRNDYIAGTTSAQIEVLVPQEVAAGGLARFGPNPYNPSSGQNAVFWYWLNEDKETSIFVFDAQGGLIWRQVYPAGSMGGQSGVNAVVWNGKNNFGEVLENGIYLYRIAQGNKSIYKGKLIILK